LRLIERNFMQFNNGALDFKICRHFSVFFKKQQKLNLCINSTYVLAS